MDNNQGNSQDKDANDNKIVHFPTREDRERLRKEKQKEETKNKKLADKERKERAQKEEQWRAQYRAEQAAKQSANLQGHLAGKEPFFNFGRIPVFTRIIFVTLFTVQIAVSFFLDAGQRLELFYTLGFVPGIYTGSAPWQLTALIAPVTSLFLHGGWMHLAFNLVMMLAMGVFFERLFGFRRTAVFFFTCGLAGNLFYFVFSPFSNDPVIGASGAISGLFAVTFLILQEQGALRGLGSKRGALPFILIWLVLIVGIGLIGPNTAWQAHLGGFLCGLGLFYARKKGFIRF